MEVRISSSRCHVPWWRPFPFLVHRPTGRHIGVQRPSARGAARPFAVSGAPLAGSTKLGRGGGCLNWSWSKNRADTRLHGHARGSGCSSGGQLTWYDMGNKGTGETTENHPRPNPVNETVSWSRLHVGEAWADTSTVVMRWAEWTKTAIRVLYSHRSVYLTQGALSCPVSWEDIPGR